MQSSATGAVVLDAFTVVRLIEGSPVVAAVLLGRIEPERL